MAWVSPSVQITGDLITAAIWNQNVVNNPIALADGQITFVFDGGTYVLATGIAGRVYIAKPLTIQNVTLGLDQQGDIVIDIWKAAHASYPPTDGDSITASAQPTITNDTDYQDGTLTGWSPAIAAGDWLFANIDSVSTATYCAMILKTVQG